MSAAIADPACRIARSKHNVGQGPGFCSGRRYLPDVGMQRTGASSDTPISPARRGDAATLALCRRAALMKMIR
jgi:hypothetical protein